MTDEIAEASPEGAEDATVTDEAVDFDPADPEGKAEAKQKDSSDEQPESEETAEASADGEDQEEDQPSDSSTEKEEGKVPQSRIDEVTRQARTAERERDYWKQRAEQNEAQTGDPEGPKLEKTLEDFEYDVGAYTQYVTEQTVQHFQQQNDEVRSRQEAEKVLEGHIAREAEFSAQVEDYQEVALNENLHVSPLMADVIRRTDDGPAVLYHLGQNPQISAKIAALSPQMQLLELGKISNRLATTSEPPKSKTPPPAKTLSGAKPPTKIRSNEPDSDKLSDEEWLKRERERVAKLGRAY